MIRQSSVYQETVKKKADIMSEFLAVKSVSVLGQKNTIK